MSNPFYSPPGRLDAYNPRSTRVTFEQDDPYYRQQRQSVSSPFDDYCKLLDSCNDTIKCKISQDEQFLSAYSYCEDLMKQALYRTIIPDVLQVPEGRKAFEELLVVTQQCKDKYAREAVDKEKETEILTKKLKERDHQVNVLMDELQSVKELMANLLPALPQTSHGSAGQKSPRSGTAPASPKDKSQKDGEPAPKIETGEVK